MRETVAGKCHKCKVNPPTIIIRTAEFCKDCFTGQVGLKFRTNIFQSKLKQTTATVGYSGGPCSSLLLHLLMEFMKPHPKRPSTITSLKIVHIDLTQFYEYDVDQLRDTIQSLGHELVVIAPAKVDISDLTLSDKEELMEALCLKTLIDNTQDVLFLGDSGTLIANRILSNTARGYGSTLMEDIALVQHKRVQMIRPLRDVIQKEISYYLQAHEIPSNDNRNLTTGMQPKASISRLTAHFLSDLENSFPSTCTTIFKTGFKIPNTHLTNQCPTCYSKFDQVCTSPLCRSFPQIKRN